MSTTALAQPNTGRITNIRGSGIEGAYVTHNRSDQHLHTDRYGYYTITNLNIGDTLRVSSLGFESVTKVVRVIPDDLNNSLAQRYISLNEVIIAPESDPLKFFADINLLTNPTTNSQELLRKVPGLVIGQHAGGGKAEQIFLRGFDIDHGTDIALSVNGMPVNMVSHAHGQGYADLHWLTPETVEHLDFGKGPYSADHGDFTTAGYVDFKLKDRLDQSKLSLELGQFETQRILGMFSVLDKQDHSAWVSTEFISTDGAFEAPQNFKRVNLMGRYAGTLENKDKIAFTGTYFTSSWDASGQIPQRSVDDGSITRFGAIDSTEGGTTGRTNVQVEYTKFIDENRFLKSQAYYSQYDFELYSNFTFFLEDSINGDQIRQKENRQIFGATTEYNQELNFGETQALLQIGGGFRNDISLDNELSYTANRQTTLDTVQLGDVHQTSSFAYASMDFRFGKWLINPAVRYDYFIFNYYDKLAPTYFTQRADQGIVSPKLNFSYNASNSLQVYLNTGKGFHSNDTRVIVQERGREILPAAYGADLGTVWKPLTNVVVNAAFWYLFLEQEFIYVGDAGIVEPSGRTERTGVDFSIRYQPLKWLYLDGDVNYTFARAVDEAEDQNYIPLAPDLTITGGMSVIAPNGFYGGLRLRHINDRPANEDNSIVAIGYTVVDLNAGYRWKNLELGIKIQNLLDTEWNETQFATESRLRNEPEPVEEIHFTPGTPFFATGVLTYNF